MAAWPDTAELAQVLNVDNVGDWTTTLNRVRAAAIAKVKSDVGSWDEDVDEPTDNMAQAALRMAVLLADREGIPGASSRDAAYSRAMTGQRRRFGVG